MRGLDDLDRAELAVLVREWLLAGHLIDRAGMPAVLGELGVEGMRDVSIDEWMGASPVYTRRMQRLLGFEGDDVATIFKGIQLDIGAPPQFMDFVFEVDRADHGEFRLASCGALMDVEPMGDELVFTMCHSIEDPTFDATAIATNPRAQVRPVHRPPRQPADRHPHCHWTVDIVDDADPLPVPAMARLIADTRAGSLPLTELAEPDGEEGRRDYSGPMDPDLWMEDFAAPTLRAIAAEVALQGHLLVLAFAAAVAERSGVEVARELVRRQFVGVAGVVADRLRRALTASADLAGVASVLELHPAFQPAAYVARRVELDADAGRVVFSLGSGPAVEEEGPASWLGLLVAGDTTPLESIVQAVDPCARVEATDPAPGQVAAWAITRGDTPADEPAEVTLTRFSTGADFVFRSVGSRR